MADQTAVVVKGQEEYVDITHDLRQVYGEWFRDDIAAARVTRDDGHVWLDLVTEPKKGPGQVIERADLAEVSALAGQPVFSPELSIEENARRLVHDTDSEVLLDFARLVQL